MCNVDDFIKTVRCKDGDCLIFAVDIDCWDAEDVCRIIGDLQKQMPNIKMAAVPSDFIEQIIHLDKNEPLIAGTFVPGITTTTYNDYTTPCVNTCYTDDELNPGWSGLE